MTGKYEHGDISFVLAMTSHENLNSALGDPSLYKQDLALLPLCIAQGAFPADIYTFTQNS
jgi:hypothetical protein